MQLETNSDLRIEPVAQFCPRCDNPTANCKCVQALNHATESENTSPSSIEDASTPGSNASSSIERNFLPASNTSSPSSSTGSMPPFPVAYPAISEIRSTATARRATPPIPIHDPTDDIDSDTPIYKSEEHMVPDRTAVLGELSHTSSEDLMKQIYGGFSRRNSREDCDSPGESAEIKLEPKCGCSCHECINTVCQDCAETVCQGKDTPCYQSRKHWQGWLFCRRNRGLLSLIAFDWPPLTIMLRMLPSPVHIMFLLISLVTVAKTL